MTLGDACLLEENEPKKMVYVFESELSGLAKERARWLWGKGYGGALYR